MFFDAIFYLVALLVYAVVFVVLNIINVYLPHLHVEGS